MLRVLRDGLLDRLGAPSCLGELGRGLDAVLRRDARVVVGQRDGVEAGRELGA